jgi:hypothetical protein
MLVLLPFASSVGVVPGFLALTAVIVLVLCPNGCILALASAAGQGPALPLNLALFNSVGNIAGIIGPLLMGVVVGATCSYNAAFVTLGVVLMLGAGLVFLVKEEYAPPGVGEGDVIKPSLSYVELAGTSGTSRHGVENERVSRDGACGAVDESEMRDIRLDES